MKFPLSILALCSFLCALVLVSCWKKASEHAEDKVVDSTPEVKSITYFNNLKEDEVASVSERIVADVNQLIGLWFGAFEMDSLRKYLVQMNDSMEMAMYGEYELSDEELASFQKRTAATKKKYADYFYTDPLYGEIYVKNPNSVSLIIESVVDDSVFGKSVCAGNERRVKGKFTKLSARVFELTLREPGDNKYDGVFQLQLNTQMSTLAGKWTPFNAQQITKNLTLKPAIFNYAPEGKEWAIDEGLIGKNVSLKVLTEQDVEEHSKQHLRILRNLIFARHGYSFRNPDVRNYFESFNWYIPVSTDVRSELTSIEQKNIALMKRYEEYAEDYYDEFGR
ncbi:MAG: YARHG domain-containing protein [Bacteroidetes bacterium]|nr:YARHG domain-containing protein [Bacteroidota bacterium]